MNTLVQWDTVLFAPDKIVKVLSHVQHPQTGEGTYMYLEGGGNPLWFPQKEWDKLVNYLQYQLPGELTTRIFVGKPGASHDP